MAARSANGSDEVSTLLKNLLAIELWRGGLSQREIRKRLGLNMNALNRLLKGVSRHLSTVSVPTS